MNTDTVLVGLEDTELKILDSSFDDLMLSIKDDTAEITNLAMNAVTSITSNSSRQKELASQGFCSRLLNDFTGKNQQIVQSIMQNDQKAIAANMQLIQKMAEKNMLSFELIASLNNKLNNSIDMTNSNVLNLNEALNNDRDEFRTILKELFNAIKHEKFEINNRISTLEQNVTLLNWKTMIKQQFFLNNCYTELDKATLAICLVTDFITITQGEWNYNNMLILKSAMSELDLSPDTDICLAEFYAALIQSDELCNKLESCLNLDNKEKYDSESILIVSILEEIKKLKVKSGNTVLLDDLEPSLKYYVTNELNTDVEINGSVFDLELEILMNAKALNADSTKKKKDRLMLKTQEKLIETCDALENLISECGLSEQIITRTQEMKINVKEQKLIVPVIGLFSAGKSFILNKIIGRNILPEDSDPKTALATELYYDTNERIEGIKSDGTIDTFDVSEMDKLSAHASDYNYSKLYINSTGIKQIRPLVLVDMPGFDSGIDEHFKAINEYIARGCYYIAITSATNGTIKSNMLNSLNEIYNYDKSFSMFLTQCNKIGNKDEIAKIQQACKDILERKFKKDFNIGVLANNSGELIVELLKTLDLEKIFLNLFRSSLRVLFSNINDSINLKLRSMKTEKNDILEAVDNYNLSIENISKKTVDLKESNIYASKIIPKILQDVDNALNLNIDNFITTAMNNINPNDQIIDVIRNAISISMNQNLDLVNVDITTDFTDIVKDLEKSIVSATNNSSFLDEKFVSNFVNNMKEVVKIPTIKNFSANGNLDSGKGNMSKYQQVVGTLSILTDVLAPVIEALLFIVPVILGPVIKSFKEKKMKEDLRNQMVASVFPTIKVRIRNILPDMLNEPIKKMIANNQIVVTENLTRRKEELQKILETQKQTLEEKENEIALIVDNQTKILVFEDIVNS